MEADSGAFSLGISVAVSSVFHFLFIKLNDNIQPVTDWKLYDSIYTERYLSIPKENGEGYNSSAVHVSEASGFNNVSYALAHGTGDDNGMLILSIVQLLHSKLNFTLVHFG